MALCTEMGQPGCPGWDSGEQQAGRLALSLWCWSSPVSGRAWSSWLGGTAKGEKSEKKGLGMVQDGKQCQRQRKGCSKGRKGGTGRKNKPVGRNWNNLLDAAATQLPGMPLQHPLTTRGCLPGPTLPSLLLCQASWPAWSSGLYGCCEERQDVFAFSSPMLF